MLRSFHTTAGKNHRPQDVPEGSAIDQQQLVERVRESLHIKSHLEFLLWLHGDFQICMPHQIFIAAWGDFSKGLVQYDVVSAIPEVRTDLLANPHIRRFVGHLFDRWRSHGSRPFGASFESLVIGSETPECAELGAFQSMHSVLVHGIRDERGRHDCLYVFMNANPVIAPSSMDNLGILLPFVDAALRQVSPLPCTLPTELTPLPHEDALATEAETDQPLSSREAEIMYWVEMGKTNHDIGTILDISSFTVKNHLQRIFRKLQVTNRAQAVSQLRQASRVAG